MKTVGMIGGIGPPSTADYYQLIIAGYQERHGEATSPRIIINSLNLFEIIPLLEDRLEELTDVLTVEVEKLAAASADFGFMAANTTHLVFDEVAKRSTIPLVSIVEATCAEAVRLGVRRLGLFGTRFTMQSGMYQERLEAEGVEVLLPTPEEQDWIHEKYFGEWLNSIFLDETRSGLTEIAENFIHRSQIEGIILGGTEIPLILGEDHGISVPLLNTTQLHVDRIVDLLDD